MWAGLGPMSMALRAARPGRRTVEDANVGLVGGAGGDFLGLGSAFDITLSRVSCTVWIIVDFAILHYFLS